MKTDFDQIIFDKDSHSYSINGQKLVSGTTVKKRLIPSFDRDGISRMVAARDGLTQAEVLEKWEAKGKIAREKGTKLHAYIEDVVADITDPVLWSVNERFAEMDAFDLAWRQLRSKLDAKMVHKEWIIGDQEWGIAGGVDAVLELTTNGKTKKHIFDWKTGKFETSCSFSKLLNPLHRYDNCKLNEYSIQLSLYRLILEKNTDYEFGDSYLVHLRDDGQYHLYRARDLRKELGPWLEDGNAKFDPDKDKKLEQITEFINRLSHNFLSKASPEKVEELLKAMNKLSRVSEAILASDEG